MNSMQKNGITHDFEWSEMEKKSNNNKRHCFWAPNLVESVFVCLAFNATRLNGIYYNRRHTISRSMNITLSTLFYDTCWITAKKKNNLLATHTHTYIEFNERKIEFWNNKWLLYAMHNSNSSSSNSRIWYNSDYIVFIMKMPAFAIQSSFIYLLELTDSVGFNAFLFTFFLLFTLSSSSSFILDFFVNQLMTMMMIIMRSKILNGNGWSWMNWLFFFFFNFFFSTAFSKSATAFYRIGLTSFANETTWNISLTIFVWKTNKYKCKRIIVSKKGFSF